VYYLDSLDRGFVMVWQVQEAKQKFSQIVQKALNEGPQIVTRHGEEVVVILAAEEFHRLTGNKLDFKEFLLSGPDFDDLDLERPREFPRESEL
jgi:prevent-host-death family protein